MRRTVGTVAVLTAGILLTTAFWPANRGMQLPPIAIAQQDLKTKTESKTGDDAKKEEPKKPAVISTKQLRKAAPGDAITPPRDERFREVEEKLRTRITVNFPDVPLREAMEYIAQLTNVDIFIDKKSLAEAGADPDQIIAWNLANYTLETVLDLILEPLQLSYHISDGLIFIETVEAAHHRMEVHVYNCRDLLKGVEDRIEAAQNNALRGGGVGGGGGGGFFQIGDGGAAAKPKGPEKPTQQPNASVTVKLSPEQSLIRVLVFSAKGPWEEVDGDGGTITAFDGLLVVRNNQQAQHDVQMVLDMLRAADKQIPARPATHEVPKAPKLEPSNEKPIDDDIPAGFKRRDEPRGEQKPEASPEPVPTR